MSVFKFSLGGHNPYVPIKISDESNKSSAATKPTSQTDTGEMKLRARVLCSYDAKDSTELNLSANEVKRKVQSKNFMLQYTQLRIFICNQIIFVMECNPPNNDYMFGKQGLTSGLVPRAFLEILES